MPISLERPVKIRRDRLRETHRATISHVQRRLIIGYNRAARLVERMEVEGVISKPNVQGMRTVLPVVA